MNYTMADGKAGKPVFCTPVEVWGDVCKILRGWETNPSRSFLRSVLFICLAGLATGAFAQADGYASQNGGTTGGAGGKVVRAGTGTRIHEALCSRGSEDEPVIIEVEGTINHGNTSKVTGNCNTEDSKINIRDVSNISLIGVGNGAVFDQMGIHLRNTHNVILQNLTIRNVKSSGSPTSNGGDAICMESDVSNVWVDHCTLEASGGEDEGYDALIDMRKGCKYVTLSYSILRNSGRGGLVGSSDSDDDNGPVTFHHNLYRNIDSRTPLLRHATAHSYNNHFDGINKSGMNPRVGGKIKVENNFIENAKDPLGTFYTEDMGFWDVSGNIWAETVTWCTEDDEHHPAGPDPTSTTSINIPYNYSPDNAACVPQIVAKTAGAGKNLAKSDGVCDLTAIRRGSMDPKGTRSDFPGFTPVYDLLGRTVCSRRPGLIVTTRGLVVVDEAVTNRGQ